jgi:hypothetical protein
MRPAENSSAPTLSLGPLGSAWFGPHDIAWSPAGYAVVALGGQDEQTVVFKVQAVAPGVALPLWTFIPNDKKGLRSRSRWRSGPTARSTPGASAAPTRPRSPASAAESRGLQPGGGVKPAHAVSTRLAASTNAGP